MFSLSRTVFSAFSLHHLESQIDMYIKGHHAYKDIRTLEIGESLNAQIEPNNPVDKFAIFLRKSVKVGGI